MEKFLVSALLSGFASILANLGVAVFNDGLRPMVPEFLEGRMDRKALAATSFALSFGLVIGFGIPLSIGSTIILIHSILLGTDIIGTSTPRNNNGLVLAGIIGALYGIGLVFGLEKIVELFSKMPIDFLPSLAKVGAPVIVGFSVFPALVVGYQYGTRNGAITLLITLFVRQIVSVFGKIPITENAKITLNPDGMALLISVVIMLIFAISDKKTEKTNSNEMLVGIFSARVARVKKNIIPLSIMGGLIAAACSLRIVAGDPISLKLLASTLKDTTGGDPKVFEAGLVALARSVGFVPLVATTAITTGVYGPAGMTFIFVIGIFIKNPIISFIAGTVILALEILLLELIAKSLDRFPGVKACGDQIRTAMTKVLEISLLVGGMIAADEMAGSNGLGFLFVGGFYLLNKTSKKPLVDMAIGPVATISFGIILNILFILHLYVPVVK
jgi:transporter permease